MTTEKHLVLARFRWDCGRNGEVLGMFVADKAELEAAYGKQVYFGEILGKHSSIGGVLEPHDITIVNEDQAFLAELVEKVGYTMGGYNPLSYLQDVDEE